MKHNGHELVAGAVREMLERERFKLAELREKPNNSFRCGEWEKGRAVAKTIRRIAQLEEILERD